MARKTSYRRTGGEAAAQNRQAAMIGAASLLAVGVLGAIVYFNPNEKIDRFGCRIGQRIPDTHTMVLIDQTDRLDKDQLDYVRSLVVQEYLRLARYERFTVVGLESEPLKGQAGAADTPAPAAERKLPNFSRCRIQSRDEANELVQNPKRIAEKFNEIVGNSMAEMFRGLETVPEGATSPILETIDRLTQSQAFGSPQIARRLVVVSDMAQYIPGGVSHYPPKGYEFGPVDAAALVSQHDFSQMAVRVHYVVREKLKTTQTKAHRQFWLDYFKLSGSDNVQLGWGLPPDGGLGDELSPIREPARTVPGSGTSFKPAPEPAKVETVVPEAAPPVATPVIPPLQPPQPAPATAAPAPVMTPPAAPRPVVKRLDYVARAYEPSRAIYVRASEVRFRNEPFTRSDQSIIRIAGVRELLDVVGLADQTDGIWYQIRLGGGVLAFVRADLTTDPVPPPAMPSADPELK